MSDDWPKSLGPKHYILKRYPWFPHPVAEETSDFEEWAKFFGSPDRIVQKTTIKRSRFGIRSAVVSTVFLGLDHSFSREGPPVLYESMVFTTPRGGLGDREQRRYTSWQAAEAGHIELCAIAAKQVLLRSELVNILEIVRSHWRQAWRKVKLLLGRASAQWSHFVGFLKGLLG